MHAPTVGTVVVQVDDDRPERLAALLADEMVVKVFHHAPFDLRWMSSHWDMPVAAVACTKVASRLLRPDAAGPEHSLRHLVAHHLGVDIDKSERLSDWTLDELTPSQLQYAAGDVEYLLPLIEVLTKQLETQVSKRSTNSAWITCRPGSGTRSTVGLTFSVTDAWSAPGRSSGCSQWAFQSDGSSPLRWCRSRPAQCRGDFARGSTA